MSSFNYTPYDPIERNIYYNLWKTADVNHTGEIGGITAVSVLKQSGLEITILREIWSVCTTTSTMNEAQFYNSLRLISMVQHGEHNISREALEITREINYGPPSFRDARVDDLRSVETEVRGGSINGSISSTPIVGSEYISSHHQHRMEKLQRLSRGPSEGPMLPNQSFYNFPPQNSPQNPNNASSSPNIQPQKRFFPDVGEERNNAVGIYPSQVTTVKSSTYATSATSSNLANSTGFSQPPPPRSPLGQEMSSVISPVEENGSQLRLRSVPSRHSTIGGSGGSSPRYSLGQSPLEQKFDSPAQQKAREEIPSDLVLERRAKLEAAARLEAENRAKNIAESERRALLRAQSVRGVVLSNAAAVNAARVIATKAHKSNEASSLHVSASQPNLHVPTMLPAVHSPVGPEDPNTFHKHQQHTHQPHHHHSGKSSGKQHDSEYPNEEEEVEEVSHLHHHRSKHRISPVGQVEVHEEPPVPQAVQTVASAAPSIVRKVSIEPVVRIIEPAYTPSPASVETMPAPPAAAPSLNASSRISVDTITAPRETSPVAVRSALEAVAGPAVRFEMKSTDIQAAPQFKDSTALTVSFAETPTVEPSEVGTRTLVAVTSEHEDGDNDGEYSPHKHHQHHHHPHHHHHYNQQHDPKLHDVRRHHQVEATPEENALDDLITQILTRRAAAANVDLPTFIQMAQQTPIPSHSLYPSHVPISELRTRPPADAPEFNIVQANAQQDEKQNDAVVDTAALLTKARQRKMQEEIQRAKEGVIEKRMIVATDAAAARPNSFRGLIDSHPSASTIDSIIDVHENGGQGSAFTVDARTNNNNSNAKADNFDRLMAVHGIVATLHVIIREGFVKSKRITLRCALKSIFLRVEPVEPEASDNFGLMSINLHDVTAINGGKGSQLQSIPYLRDDLLICITVKGNLEVNLEVDGGGIRDTILFGLQGLTSRRKKIIASSSQQ